MQTETLNPNGEYYAILETSLTLKLMIFILKKDCHKKHTQKCLIHIV